MDKRKQRPSVGRPAIVDPNYKRSISIQARATPLEHAKLLRFCEKYNYSISRIIEEALELFFKKEKFE